MYLRSVIIFSVFLLELATVVCIYVCPSKIPNIRNDRYAKVYGKTCYRFVSTHHRYWLGAYHDCEKYGGNLAMIEDEETNKFLANQITENFDRTGYWIGLVFITDPWPPKWRLADGREASFFKPYGPNLPEENCITLLPSGRWWRNICVEEKGGKEDVYSVYDFKPYICQYPAEWDPTQTEAPTTTTTPAPTTTTTAPPTTVRTTPKPTDKPVINYSTTFFTGSVGGSVTLPCPIKAVPLPTNIRWKRIVNGFSVYLLIGIPTRYTGSTPVGQQYGLTIGSLQDDDAGTYQCEADNDAGTGYGTPVTLVFNYVRTTHSTPKPTCPTFVCPVDCGMDGYQMDENRCLICKCDV